MNKTLENIFAGIGGIAIVGVILYFVFGGSSPSSPSTPSKTMAFVMAKRFVEKQLKSPSTADFCSYSKNRVRNIDECTFEVSGFVDSQNSFGATLRSNFVVTVANCEGDDTWSLIDSNIY